MFYKRPLIVMDFETTGMNPDIHDIIEMGALKVQQDTLQVLDTFEVKIPIQHFDTIQPAALKCNGYTEALWKDAIPLHDALDRFRLFSYGGVFCAWNITFEYRFLCAGFNRADMENIFLERRYSHHIDIPSIVWSKFPRLENISYDQVAAKLGIEPEPKPHRAINGALHNLNVLRALSGLKAE